MIHFTKDICFIDIESTSTDPQTARIVEICIAKLKLDGERIVKTHRIYPGIPIPPAATEIHGITDNDVKDKPLFKQLAAGILSFILGCDIAGFNSNAYDVPLLLAEFERCGHTWNITKHNFIDCCNIYKIKEPRTLAAAVKFYTGKDLEDAHSAEADILATINVFQAQIERYFDVQENTITVEELDIFCNYGKKRLDLDGMFAYREDGKTIYFTRGKYKDQNATVDSQYLLWICSEKATFSSNTKMIARKIYDSIPFK